MTGRERTHGRGCGIDGVGGKVSAAIKTENERARFREEDGARGEEQGSEGRAN